MVLFYWLLILRQLTPLFEMFYHNNICGITPRTTDVIVHSVTDISKYMDGCT